MVSSYQAGSVLSPPPVHQVVTSFRAIFLVMVLSLSPVLLIGVRGRGASISVSPTCFKFYIGITANTVCYTADEGLQMFYVIYQQRERVFHRDIQTRENNEARVFSYIVFECLDIPVRHELESFIMFSFADLTIEFLTKHNVIRNYIQVILHA